VLGDEAYRGAGQIIIFTIIDGEILDFGHVSISLPIATTTAKMLVVGAELLFVLGILMTFSIGVITFGMMRTRSIISELFLGLLLMLVGLRSPSRLLAARTIGLMMLLCLMALLLGGFGHGTLSCPLQSTKVLNNFCNGHASEVAAGLFEFFLSSRRHGVINRLLACILSLGQRSFRTWHPGWVSVQAVM
jgi:hypothetical protein